MTRTARQAAYEAFQGATDTGSEIWGGEVYADLAEPNAEYPFLLIWRIGGGQDNDKPGKRSAELLMGAAVVSNKQAHVVAGSQRLTALFDDQGDQEDNTVPGTSDWYIHTITQELPIYNAAKANTQTIWQEGHQFRLIMEEK